ncbi:fer-1-like protein 6 isoform X3 [Aphis gossypii]|uniref:fer-1-like protein 6 isoform X3 n=1 Tax=Aphis gossypii TaxID=80765 RepID=UPI00215911AD|nr:fer-1-like protein 6 isoform X3 [Aphis gossypii]
MIKKLITYHESFEKSYNKYIKLHKHIHTSCVNNMELFKQYCLKEIKTIFNLTHTETDILILLNRIKDTFDQLLVCRKNKSYNGPPNIFLNLHNGKQIVSRCQIQTRNFLFSKVSECKGKFCRRIRPWFLSTEIKKNVFDGIMETLFWIGPYEDFNVGLRQIPGFLYNDFNDQPCSEYNYKLYEKTFLQLKAHISQAALTEKCYKKYSQLNLMARIIFNGHSMTTNVINSNESTSWNISVLFKPSLFTWYGDTNKSTPIYVIIQLCHVSIEKNKLIEDVIAFTVINIKEINNSSLRTLNWYNIVDGLEKIGKMFIGVEITQIISNELSETDGNLNVPLLKYVQPKLCVYKLFVLFWGLRQFNIHLHEPFVRLLCSSLSIDSDIIKNFNSFPNFPDIDNKKYVFNLELPEDPNLIPPISFQLFTKYVIKNSYTPLGICVSQPLNEFLVPTISKTQWNEQPGHTILEIEDDNDKEEKKEKIKKIKKTHTSKVNLKFNCNYLKQKFDIIIPIALKNIFWWIIEHVTFILTLLYNTMCYILPCLNDFTYWISNNLKNYISYIGNKYIPLIDDELEEDEKEFNWWTKYYGFKYQKNTFRGNTHIYDRELESIPEFNGFEDNLKKFKLYELDKKNEKTEVIGTLKGNVNLYPIQVDNGEQGIQELLFSNSTSQIWPGLKSNDKCKLVVRVYILRANNLHPGDISGLSDSYIEIVLGKSIRITDSNNYIPKTLNPVFGKCYEREISFPKCSMLKVRIMDYDRIGRDELIGETTIDIESRYFSKHRAHCGLPKQYNKDGYNRWRDSEKPSKILHKLCSLYSLKHPIYTTDGVTIGSKTFHVRSENTDTDRQSLALFVLNHWQEMPGFGYHLVPEYVETRTLYHPDMPNLHQGTLEMWIDMFSKDGNIPEMVDIKPPIVELYELRVVIWTVTEVKLVDNNFFTKEKHSDIYIKGWLPGVEKQSTDVHYRSLNGEGLFNWRLKFLFPYNKTENIIVYREKNIFGFHNEEQQFTPKLHLEIWDNDQLSPDSYIGSLTLNLRNMPRGAKSSWISNLSKKSRINLFKVKKTSGWWPFIFTENNKNTVVGKVNADIQIMTKEEADKLPAGFGRDGPQPLTVPKRPSIHYLQTIIDPFRFIFRSLFVANKTKFLIGLLVVFVILFFLMLIYAIPGNIIRIIFDKFFKK